MSESKYAMVVDKDGFVVKDNKNHKIFVLVKITNYEGVEKETPEDYILQESNSLIYKDWDIANSMISPQWNGKTWIETGKVEITPELISALRKSKLQEVNAACQNFIFQGVNVETSQGLKHFSLSETDQINISTWFAQVGNALTGQETKINLAVGVPYHADGELCRFWSIEDFTKIATSATAHAFYHQTYCNHLREYIKRLDDYEALKAITYGDELPEDLQSSMALLLGV